MDISHLCVLCRPYISPAIECELQCRIPGYCYSLQRKQYRDGRGLREGCKCGVDNVNVYKLTSALVCGLNRMALIIPRLWDCTPEKSDTSSFTVPLNPLTRQEVRQMAMLTVPKWSYCIRYSGSLLQNVSEGIRNSLSDYHSFCLNVLLVLGGMCLLSLYYYVY